MSDAPWWTITVEGLTRVGVQAWTQDEAWEEFLRRSSPKSHDRFTKQVQRKVPPKRTDCKIVRATEDERRAYTRTRKKPSQAEALFDTEAFSKTKGKAARKKDHA